MIERKSVFILLVSFLFSGSSSTALAEIPADSKEWSYPAKSSIWHEALGPHNKDAIAVIEGRPFSFASTNSKRAQLYKSYEHTFEKALILAKPHAAECPSDIVHCYVNIGVYYYLQGDLTQADNYMKEALRTARKYSSDYSLGVAEVLEYRAMIQRTLAGQSFGSANSKKHFDIAKKYYDHILKTKEKSLSEKHEDIEHTNSHKLMTLLDEGDSDEATKIATNVPAYTLTPFMPSISQEDSFAKMVAFAEKMVEKYTPPPVSQKDKCIPIEPEFGTIAGHWYVPVGKTKNVEKVASRTVQEIDGEKHITETESDVKSPLEGVKIFLCRFSSYNRIYAQIYSFANHRGLDPKEYLRTWPVTKSQGIELIKDLDAVANNIAIRTSVTNNIGDYEFPGNVPEGKFFLYASVGPKAGARAPVMIWLLPEHRKPIIVEQKRVHYNFDFSTETGTDLWSLNKRTENKLKEVNSKVRRLVPPPPPNVMPY